MARILKQDSTLREKFQQQINQKIQKETQFQKEELQKKVETSVFTKHLVNLMGGNVESIVASQQQYLQRRGEKGEQSVSASAERLPDDWIIFNDVLLEPNSETLVQIDHVIIGLAGIFIVETKAWEGAFSGYRDEWKRREGNNWVECPSPTLQNARQANLLQQWIQKSNFTNITASIEQCIIPVVVFTSANWLKTKNCSTLVFDGVSALIAYIGEGEKKRLTLEQVNQIASLIAHYPSYQNFDSQAQPLLLELPVEESEKYCQSGILKAKQGRYQEAIEDFTSALKIKTSAAEIYKYRGVARSRIGDFQEALKDLEAAAKLYNREEKTSNYQKVLEHIRQLKTNPPELQLISAVGTEYTKLRELLAAEQWLEADKKTFDIMLKVAPENWSFLPNTGKRTHISTTAIENFPCPDLRTLDELWMYYSNGHFGFSVQKRIWESNNQNFDTFMKNIGWYSWPLPLSYEKLTFTLDAPQGHLPVGVAFQWRLVWQFEREEEVRAFFSRLEICKI